MISSEYHTKKWRKSQEWYTSGKKNECEKFQIRNISKIFENMSITQDRVNLTTGEIKSVKHPFHREDAFDWTENFDGLTHHRGKKIYFNFKFVVGSGGAQTRSLREVYHYIKKQKGYIFVNILDGDESFRRRRHFRHMLSLTKYVGDSYDFPAWYGIVFMIDLPDDVKNIIIDML